MLDQLKNVLQNFYFLEGPFKLVFHRHVLSTVPQAHNPNS